MNKRGINQSYMILIGAAVVYAILKVLIVTGMIGDYWQLILDESMITTIAALGLSLIYGFNGQFSLGQAAFYGLGAYAAGAITKAWGHGNWLWFVVALIAGPVAGGLISYLIGRPILRLVSDYLGIATLGFGIIVTTLLNNADKVIPILGGAVGMTGMIHMVHFDLIFVFTVGAILLVRNFVQSSPGRAVVSIREDEIAADAMGIDTTRYKTLAFVVGGALSGFAGALYAHRYPYLNPSSFDFLQSVNILLIVVLGGLGSISGTVGTAVGWVFLLEGLRFVLGQQFLDFRGVIYALVLIVVIILRPQGLFGGKEIGFLKPPSIQKPVLGPGKESSHAGLGG